jgi:hypothetical protein
MREKSDENILLRRTNEKARSIAQGACRSVTMYPHTIIDAVKFTNRTKVRP